VKISEIAAEFYGDFPFLKKAVGRHLGFCWILISDHSQSLPDDLKLCLKFYAEPIYTFKDIAISIFRNMA